MAQKKASLKVELVRTVEWACVKSCRRKVHSNTVGRKKLQVMIENQLDHKKLTVRKPVKKGKKLVGLVKSFEGEQKEGRKRNVASNMCFVGTESWELRIERIFSVVVVVATELTAGTYVRYSLYALSSWFVWISLVFYFQLRIFFCKRRKSFKKEVVSPFRIIVCSYVSHGIFSVQRMDKVISLYLPLSKDVLERWRSCLTKRRALLSLEKEMEKPQNEMICGEVSCFPQKPLQNRFFLKLQSNELYNLCLFWTFFLFRFRNCDDLIV